MDIPRDKNYPVASVQCNACGGHGCLVCEERGWLAPITHPNGRRCVKCNKPLHPTFVAVYCSNDCALADTTYEDLAGALDQIRRQMVWARRRRWLAGIWHVIVIVALVFLVGYVMYVEHKQATWREIWMYWVGVITMWCYIRHAKISSDSEGWQVILSLIWPVVIPIGIMWQFKDWCTAKFREWVNK